MSAVGAVICNSYQDTGSYLFCGSHKALFKNKNETKKKVSTFTEDCFPISSSQFCLRNFIIICHWYIFGFMSKDMLNCWPLQETLKPLLLMLNFWILFSFQAVGNFRTFSLGFKKKLKSSPGKVRCFQVFCLLIVHVIINYAEYLAGHAFLC